MIELHPAFVWDCEDCGRENFQRALCGNMDEAAFMAILEEDGDILADFVSEPGVDFDDDGCAAPRYIVSRVTMCPRVVVCRHCGHTEQTKLHIAEGP